MTDEPRGAGAPTPEDERFDDLEFNPQLEPSKATAWLNLLEESEKAYEEWNDHADKIERMYANLARLSDMYRDKEFSMFWSNMEVIKPSIYAKPPQPVVVTKFKDRRPVPNAAAEVLERCATVAFDLARIDETMKLVRDDVAMLGRGVPWCRYESKGEGYYDYERVCVDYKHRKDFLHSVSRCWYEVWWVAGASYLTRSEARDRFKDYSGDEYQDAEYTVDRDTKDVGGADNRERAKFWEIWDKKNRRCVWVAKGCELILDEADPHLELTNFFPCPCPAYGTLQRNSLVPVPDVLQYRDQLQELNQCTAKIHAMSAALEAKGFYPAGSAELSEAIQTAITTATPGRLLIPISNWAAFGGSKEVIIWMPMAEIAGTIQTLIAIRKEIIQDVYQIMGLSDIMRGATDARETLGAQQLKSQFGSTRVRDKQTELVRLSKDLVQIVSEIITDKFDDVTIIEMSQTQLPTQAMQRTQVMQLQQQLANQQQGLQRMQQLASQASMPPPGAPQQGQPPQQGGPQPEAMQQLMSKGQEMLQEGQRSIEKIMAKPTFEQVMTFLRDNRAKAFVLDIETDSTVMIDEQTEKQRRAEFIGALSQILPQLAQMIAAEPQTAEFCGEILKFGVAPFRAGRSLDGAINDLAEMMKAKADQPKGDDPATAQNKAAIEIEKMKDSREKEKIKADAALKLEELKQKDQHKKWELEAQLAIESEKLKASAQDDAARSNEINLKNMANREKHQADMIKKQADVEAGRAKLDITRQQSAFKQQDMQAKADERRAMQQFKMMQPPPQRGGMPR